MYLNNQEVVINIITDIIILQLVLWLKLVVRPVSVVSWTVYFNNLQLLYPELILNKFLPKCWGFLRKYCSFISTPFTQKLISIGGIFTEH